jgi:hypothetical protein
VEAVFRGFRFAYKLLLPFISSIFLLSGNSNIFLFKGFFFWIVCNNWLLLFCIYDSFSTFCLLQVVTLFALKTVFPPFALKQKVEPKIQGGGDRSARPARANAQQGLVTGYNIQYVSSIS